MLRFSLLGSTTICRAPDGDGGAAAAATGAAGIGAAATAGAASGADTGAGGGVAAPAAGAADNGWISTLPEEQRLWVGQKGYQTPSDLVKGAHAAEKAIGLEKIAIPKPDSPKEVYDDLYKKLGRPDDVAGYGFKAPEGFPDYDPKVGDAFGAKALELGLTAKQGQGIHDWFMGLAGQTITGTETAVKAVHDSNYATLQTEWGTAFNVKNEQANAAIAAFGGDELIAELKKYNFHSNPALNKAFAKVGAAMAPDSAAGTGGGSMGYAKTPAEAQAEIKRIEGDFKGPYHDKMHAEHKLTVQKLAELYAMAYPEQKAN